MKIKTVAISLSVKEQDPGLAKAFAVLVFFLFLWFGYGESVRAQDVLILKSGTEIKVNIIEEGADIIRYREFDNPGGPLYSIGKDKVASIKYKKGTKGNPEKSSGGKETIKPAEAGTDLVSDAFHPLTYKKRNVLLDGKIQSVRNVKTLMEDYPEAQRLYESGKFLGNASNACAGSVIVVCLIANIAGNKSGDDEGAKKAAITGLGISGVLIISGIILASAGRHHIRSAVTLYNSAANKPVSYKLNLGIQNNGIGLALRF